MNCRKFKHNPLELLREGERIAASSETNGKYMKRVITVNMVLSGRNIVAQATEKLF